VVVLVFMTLGILVQRYLLSYAAVHIDSATLDFLTRKLLALPMSYFSARRTGDIQRRLDGLRQVREFVAQSAVGGLTAVVKLVTLLALMVVYRPLLAGVFLVTAPLYALMMCFSARWLRPLYDKLEEAFGHYRSYQIDAIKASRPSRPWAPRAASAR
jgi:ABC-type bacteriocin/lantibiotic exporter with double-glycine peptidase domain